MKILELFDDLIKRKDESMVSSIIWRITIKGMSFEKAVKDTLSKNRKGIIEQRKNKIIDMVKKELKKMPIDHYMKNEWFYNIKKELKF